MRPGELADRRSPAPADDPVRGLVGFTAVLRAAGLAVTTDRVAAFLSAVDPLDVTSQLQTYWAGRLTLCSDPDDLPRYDQAFADWFTPARRRTHRGSPTSARRPPPKLAALDPARRRRRGRPDAPAIAAARPGQRQPRCCAAGTSPS